MPIGWLPVQYKDHTFAWQNRSLAAKNKLLLLQPAPHPGDTRKACERQRGEKGYDILLISDES